MMDRAPLTGTDLLAGSRLSIDWRDGGNIVIEEGTLRAELRPELRHGVLRWWI
jgi:hypothetical protein